MGREKQCGAQAIRLPDEGAIFMTENDMMVIPRSTGTIKSIRFKRYTIMMPYG